MVAWSAIGRVLSRQAVSSVQRQTVCSPAKGIVVQQLRHSGGHGPKTFVIKPSDWQWDKFKDLLHFYIMVGVIPITGILIYANVFVGPATLAPIPDGYEPAHWEYHRHPVTRFLARYITRNPQQEYEKMCHELYEESEKALLRQLEKDIKSKMAERLDYQAWYYKPAMVKYARHSKKFFEEHSITVGS